MEIGVKEAALLLNVPEDTVHRWVRQEKLPAARVNGQVRFNRAELLEWATANQANVSAQFFPAGPREQVASVSLENALRRGGVHYDLPGADKASVLDSAIRTMTLPDDVDRSFLLRVILARESMGSTGIGDGIAIPHVRNPIVMQIAEPIVSLCFLKCPIEFDAIDGKPVHTMFMIVCPVIQAHLNLVSRLAFGLRQPAFAGTVKGKKPPETIYKGAAIIDKTVSEKARDSMENKPI